MTETTLRNIDTVLMASGGLVIVAAVLAWRFGSTPPGIRRDLLRHSPLRVNRLGIIGPWFCLAGMFLSTWAGSSLAPRLAPNFQGDALRIWQGNFAASLTAIVNTMLALLVAHAMFARGLNGFGIGRRSFRLEIGVAILGWLVAICVTGLLVRASDWYLGYFYPDYVRPEHGVFQALKNAALPRWMRAFTIVSTLIFVPVGEEVLFRGILQTAVQRLIPVRHGSFQHRWAAIIIVGTAFGMLHGSTPQHIPALIALGMLLGYLYERTGSLLVPIYVHMLFNGKSLLIDYLIRAYLHIQ